MKFIHCADIHLDSSLTSVLSADRAALRNTELLETFLRMVRYGSEHDVDGILISGDLFDSDIVSVNTREAVRNAVVSHPEMSFFYLKGNHDENTDQLFVETVPDNIYFFDQKWKTYHFDDGTAVSGIEIGNDAPVPALKLDPSDFNIVMMHGELSSKPSSASSEIINFHEIHGSVNYLALGHIHKHIEAKLPSGTFFCYPGCLEGRGYDETGKHGFELIDINPVSKQFHADFIPFAKRTVFSLRADITGCVNSEQIVRIIAQMLQNNDVKKDDMVQMILCGTTDVTCEKNTEYIRSRFSGQLFDMRVTDQTKLAVDPSEYETDASLKGELVRIVMNDKNLSEEEKAEIIRCGLQALNGETIAL